MNNCKMTLEEFRTYFLPEEFPVCLLCDNGVREYEVPQIPKEYLTRRVLFISAFGKGRVMICLKSKKIS